MVRKKTVASIALFTLPLIAGGLALTGHTGWTSASSAPELLASRTICFRAAGGIEVREVASNGRWSRCTDDGFVASGKLRARDRKALEAAAAASPPPSSATNRPTVTGQRVGGSQLGEIGTPPTSTL